MQRSSEAWILDVNSTHIIRSNDVQAVLWTSCASSVTSQNDEFQNGCFKKTKYANFSEKRTFLNFWCAHARVRIRGGDKKLSFFGKIGLLFLNTRLEILPFSLITNGMFTIYVVCPRSRFAFSLPRVWRKRKQWHKMSLLKWYF